MIRWLSILALLVAARAEAQVEGYAALAAYASAYPVPTDGLLFWHRPGITQSTNAYYGGSYPATMGNAMMLTPDGYMATNKSSFVSIPSLPGGWEEAVAMFAWIKITNAATHYLFCNSGHLNQGDGFRVYVASTGVVYGQYLDSSTVYRGRITGSGSIAPDAWTHIGFVKETGAVTNLGLYSIWINGAQADVAGSSGGTMSGSGEAYTNRLTVANLQGSVTGGLEGSIDEILVYAGTVPKTAMAISGIMNSTRGTK